MKNKFLIDAHLDLGGIILNRRRKGMTHILNNFLPSFKSPGFKLVIAAIFIETDYTDIALREALLQIQAVKKDIKECEMYTLVTSKADLLQLKETDKIGILLSLEGAEPILRQLDLLDMFYDLGVRGLGLVWSRRNFVADGSYFRDPEEGIKGGLTPFGIEVLRRANVIGYFIDVSHLNDTGFEDVLKYMSGGFIASHSNSRVINGLTRNLTDEQILAIATRKGVIGINAYTKIVSEKIEEQTIDRLCDHIEHIINVGGEDCIGFGFDLCTPYYDNGKQLDVLKDHSDTIKIKENLINRGFFESTIDKILGDNMYSFLLKHL